MFEMSPTPSVIGDACETRSEELANSISHGIGAILSIGALVAMVFLAAGQTAWHVVSVSIFGGSLVLLYSASTCYHAARRPRAKRVLQVLDHACIFVLIAGSYTPWMLVNLRGPWGWSLLGVVWGLAVFGSVLKAVFLPRFDKLGTALYVVMGWLIVLVSRPLLESVSTSGLIWLFAGGLAYSGGVYFYLKKEIRYGHLIWHLFVIAGSLCHVLAVVYGVL